MTHIHPTTAREEILLRLREALAQATLSPAEVVRSGCAPLDAVLPGGGLHRGTLVEWLGEPGAGAGTLALQAAVAACGAEGTLLVVDGDGSHTRNGPPEERFYPPAAVRLGLRVEQLIVVRPANSIDYAWTLDQSLRCSGLSAVLAWPRRLSSQAFRRLQLAAEASTCLGLLVRPVEVRTAPSWADIRVLVHPQLPVDPAAGRRLRLELLRCRGASHRLILDLEYDHATGALRLVAGSESAASFRQAE